MRQRDPGFAAVGAWRGMVLPGLLVLGAGCASSRATRQAAPIDGGAPAEAAAASPEAATPDDAASLDAAPDAQEAPGAPDAQDGLQVSCMAPLTACGDTCVDTRHNDYHCGSCGQACRQGAYCDDGTCRVAGCGEGAVRCGEDCIDPVSDRDYCGAEGDCEAESAGEACAPDEACRQARCQACPIVASPPRVSAEDARWGALAVVGGDLDGDGDTDFVTDVYADRDTLLQVFLQTEAGLVASEPAPGWSYSFGIELLDLNDDGALDILPRRPHATRQALLGRGDGSFEPLSLQGIPTDLAGPYAGRAVRLDDDAHPDFYHAYQGILTVAFGQADGTLGPAQQLDSLGGGAGFAVADFTGDGVHDLLVGRCEPDALVLFTGLEGGGYQATPEVAAVPGEGACAISGATDFDQDGHVDILLHHSAAGGWHPHAMAYGESWQKRGRVLLGLGGARFGEPMALPYEGSTGQAELADVDGDGHLDIVHTLEPHNTAEWGYMRSRGDGSFEPQRYYAVGHTSMTWPRAALGDVTGDGIVDLVAPASGTQTLEIFEASAPGVFEAPPIFPGVTGQAVDFSGKGPLELVFVADDAIVAARLEPHGHRLRSLVDGIPALEHVLATDVDGDGVLDLVGDAGELLWLWRGLAGGGYGAGESLATQPSSSGLRPADLEGTGAHALLRVDSDGSLRSFAADATGTWAELAPRALGSTVTDLTIGDLDGDGRDDLAFYDGAAQELRVLRRDDSEPWRPTREPVRARPRAIVALDGDGLPELLAEQDGNLVVLQGLGEGRLGSARVVPGGSQAWGWPTVGDLDGDGAQDLVITTRGSVQILLGTARGTFREGPGVYRYGSAPRVGDFDGDGVADLASAHSAGLVFRRGVAGEGCP